MSVTGEEKAHGSGSETSSIGHVAIYERPRGWRGIYYHPATQVCLVGFVCFMCPGMFNALTGLGAGGQVDATTTANANPLSILPSPFLPSFLGHSVHNVLGPKRCLLLGTWGYSLLIGSYLATNIHPGAGDFVVVAGAILGACAALVWTAQGSLMMAYPTEAQKGTFIGYFWAIFNVGGVVGSAVAFGSNFNSEANKVGNATYVSSSVMVMKIFDHIAEDYPYKMIRTDGTRVTPIRYPSWKTEFISLFVALKTDPWIVLLFPMFFASNYFYTWQFNDYNGALFNIRTRGLNNFVYWTAQIFGSFFIGHFVLDLRRFRRRVRAFLGWTIVVVFVFAVNVWSYYYQLTYTRASDPPTAVKIDIHDSSYPPYVWLMIFYGLLDSMWQTTAYWLMGAMSNDPAKLAVFTGFYKCFQSAGSAVVWRLDAVQKPYMDIFISTWVLTAAGMIFAFPLVYVRLKDHTEMDDEALLARPNVGRLPEVSQK
ncbi:MFS general substrate transporter [Suillus bovinus]|uniref:MFS general substrate transporter n=1 Tax=Suillus bovinus TaxID=48563 RepID=UPI001B86530D|nr:MFS general substrate transporter [Suillus bovinus]KAG2127551.1 MFS general substrate transporter [Suillus bovinus]